MTETILINGNAYLRGTACTPYKVNGCHVETEDGLTPPAGMALWLKAGAGVFEDNLFTTPATDDADVVGGWQDQSGIGYDVSQGTLANKPTLKLNILNGYPVLRFNGTTNYLARAVANWLSGDNTGKLFFVCKLNASTGTILGSSDTAGIADYFFAGGRLSTNYYIGTQTSIGSTINGVRGGTSISGAWVIGCIKTSGSAWTIRVNGADETLSVVSGSDVGNWVGDVSNRDNICVGALVRSSVSTYFKNDIAEILYYSGTSVSDADVETYLNTKYAVY